jgi:hypothetical protein
MFSIYSIASVVFKKQHLLYRSKLNPLNQLYVAEFLEIVISFTHLFAQNKQD